jgi:serine/threonine-protein kinase
MGEATPTIVGRYALFGEFASGGMATVHLGRLLGPSGFSRTVAIKRLHRHLANERTTVTMLMDEARLSARIRHPNVVPTLDVVSEQGELLIVMEYVHGDSLATFLTLLADAKELVPLGIAVRVIVATLHGLHAAHETKSERGRPLAIVHRDVSPQNILIGFDGVVRVADFGIAKAEGNLHTTRAGVIKGKLAYMPPEQVQSRPLDRRTDVYAASVLLWELLTGRRLFLRDRQPATIHAILNDDVPPPSAFAPGIPPELDAIVRKGLDRDPDRRFATAEEMALELAEVVPLPHEHEVGAWARDNCGNAVGEKEARLAEVDALSAVLASPLSPPEPPEPTFRRRLGDAVVVALGAVTAVAVLGVGVRLPTRASAASLPVPTLESARIDSTSPGPGAPASEREREREREPATHPASEPSASAAPPTTAARHNAPVAPAARPRPRLGASGGCDPLFTIDSSGIKVPKPNCIR